MQQPISTLKGIIVIIITIVIAVGGVFTYEYSVAERLKNIAVLDANHMSNPETAGWKTYTNNQYGFSFQYPATTTLSENNKQGSYWGYTPYEVNFTNVATVSVSDINGVSGGLAVNIGNDPKLIENCLKFNFYAQLSNMTDVQQINGVTFYTKSQGDAASGGQRGIITQYSVVYNNYCYTLQTTVQWQSIAFLHGATDGKNPTQEEIDKENNGIQSQKDLLSQVVKTFKFTK